MYGLASISEFQKRIDLFDKSDWQSALHNRNYATLACARDPVGTALVGFPFSPLAFWAFEPKLSATRMLAATPDIMTCKKELHDKADRIRATLDCYAALVPFLLGTCKLKPTIEQLCDILQNIRYTSEFGVVNLADFMRGLAPNYVIEWIDVNDISLALLIERNKVRTTAHGALLPNANALLNQIAGLIYDYHAFRLPLWRSAPITSSSSSSSSADTARLRNTFADPISFDPTQSSRPDRFFWPWQRCLVSMGLHEVRYRPIPTTSLVLDMRASTSAMELTDPTEKFSEFIDTVVLLARTTILRYGGYFDKETGDGVVGHFCSATDVPRAASIKAPAEMELVAVRAAQEIVQKVQDLCLSYQRWLRHGMTKLGAAAGIHTDNSVWLADEMQVRAIGASVVGAARLCKAAESGEIVISNRIYETVDDFKGSIDGLTFHKKPISFQEYGDRIGTFAYAAKAVA